MKKTGSIARNFHQGTRSEYLAQYFFTAFGTSIPVPHPEDSGIDLYCTLGEEEGKRLIVNNYYLVQVKSDKNNIEYESLESCNWLLFQKYPLFICVISKKENIIEIFSLFKLAQLMPNSGINVISLRFDNEEKDELTINTESTSLNLSTPIIKCNVVEISKGEKVKDMKKCLRYWIELDQENLIRKSIGLNISILPKNFNTNEIPINEVELKGNFLSQRKTSIGSRYYETLFLLLSNEINFAASKNDKNKFKSISDLSIHLLKSVEIMDSYGIRMLQIAINTGARKLSSSRKLHLNVDGKNILTDIIKIIE